jgi:deoxyribodipyrimidine photolyase-related protein
MEITLVFPHQLFKASPASGSGRLHVLFEDPLYFSQYKFHKKKILLHRTSMKYYESWLGQKGIECEYKSARDLSSLKSLFDYLAKRECSCIHYVYTDDYLLERRINGYCEEYKIEAKAYVNPMFLLDRAALDERLGNKKSYFMASFYKEQRRHTGLLMNGEDPEGGKWSFDEYNRKKLPDDVMPPDIYIPQTNSYVREAAEYVEASYPDNPGNVDGFIYPVTHYQAEKWLADFIENRLRKFGDYEDAISDRSTFLFHSVLTPALNIGLLTPAEAIDAVMAEHEKNAIPLNSLEGFIRQLIGWREFMRGVYLYKGTYQRTHNYFGHTRKIPKSFWAASTGIDPIDDTIRKVTDQAYAHHIERLMIIGNFMLLCEFEPDEIYRWFMELFIDAYDWVMVPNVYGMTQYSDGGLITTKPYISGSNYIRKMSNYRKGEWSEIWDGLYWRFLHVNREKFEGNHRMNMVLSLLDRMDKDKLNNHIEKAEAFLQSMQE